MNEAESDRARPQAQLLDEAIDLVIRLQEDPRNPVADEMARSWRARSAEHERLWQRVLKLHGASGHVLTERREHDSGAAGLTRRNLVIGALSLGAAGAAAAVLPDLVRQARADHATGTAEIRQVRLPDGSLATLGPDTSIALDFSVHARRVDLIGGMSFFDVARDAARPFTVAAGPVTATALGTSFDVAREGEAVSVEVDRGLVLVQAPASAAAPSIRLADGDWLAYDPGLPAPERGTRAPGQVAAWRDRLIIAERESVSTLVARIGRWLPGRIVMAAPYVGSQRVSGVFDLSDPALALEAVVLPAGGRVRRISSFATLISPI